MEGLSLEGTSFGASECLGMSGLGRGVEVGTAVADIRTVPTVRGVGRSARKRYVFIIINRIVPASICEPVECP